MDFNFCSINLLSYVSSQLMEISHLKIKQMQIWKFLYMFVFI